MQIRADANVSWSHSAEEQSAFLAGVSRREFLKLMAATSAMVGSGSISWAEGEKVERSGDMIYRTLGSTGERVSAIGLGGFHLGQAGSEAESVRIARSAIDRGLTFMDNCWDYNNGDSEVRMGKALRDGYRSKAFLMTKIDGHTKSLAAKQIDQSLQRLQTDHVDLMQFHEVIRMTDPEKIFASGGSFEAMMEAKKAGKVRYIGFTGHKDPKIHLHMLDTARRHGFKFDAVQMPLNVMDAHFRSFQHQVVPVLVKEGIGVLGMKSMGSGIILKSGKVSAIECLHYALSLPTSVVITGINSMKILDQAFEAARTYQPPTPEQTSELLARTKAAASKGEFELFKTSSNFDGTAHNPQWLG